MSVKAGTKQGDWVWTCACGTSGEPKADREQARAEYKVHRQSCIPSRSTKGEKVIMSTVASENAPRPKPASATKKKGPVSEADAKKALAAIKAGSSLIAQSHVLGFKGNNELRAALRKLLGREAYDKLMSTRRGATRAVSEADAKKALAALRSGTSTLIAQSKALGFSHNGPLRGALRKLIGREAYDKLMEDGRSDVRAARKKVKTPSEKSKPKSKPVGKKADSGKKKVAAGTEPAVSVPTSTVPAAAEGVAPA